ncbi:MAG: CPBP family intramembrane metalloprotease [Clostridiales bacterium]|nr:CPBP family intramembrane metalloprotease [Clostridiales bacterium]
MINQWFWIIVGIIAIRFLCPNLTIYLKLKYFKNGWKNFWLSIIIMICVSALAFSLGLIGKYNYTPSVEKVVIEGFIYYISVAIIEELYIRALLLNIIERIACKSKHATLIAIIVSSALFGLGHIIGMIGQDVLTIICRVIWTISLGIYLGVIYKKSNNLWLPIVVHALVDFCSVCYCFVTTPIFSTATVIIIAVSYFAVAMLLLYIHYIKPSLKGKI